MSDAYVYTIKNNATNRIYVGCTVNAEWRYKTHMDAMRRGRHKVEDMQEDYDRFGADSFCFKVYGKFPYHRALQQEIFISHVLRTKDRRFGYNYKDKHGESEKVISTGWRLPSFFLNLPKTEQTPERLDWYYNGEGCWRVCQ